MKKILLCMVLTICALLTSAYASDNLQLRGIWVTTAYGLDYPSQSGLSAEMLAAEIDAIVQNAKNLNLNAVFLQVRPNSDAIYPSEIYPQSAYISGAQGVAPDQGFDSLAYFINACHNAGIELHAWINPYRITRISADSREQAFASLSEHHPAHDMQSSVVFHSDGCLYFDPASPEARALIIDGIAEILQNYPVDGIHFDDYFYPSENFDDSQSYELYGQSFSDIGDFRRNAVDTLVSEVHTLCTQAAPDADFGISPFGIWATAAHHPLGSETGGSQSYYSHYADSHKWVREGMVDYIMPQLYWQIGASSGDFVVMLDWWSQTVSGTDVKLYIGLAAYRATDAEPDSIWHNGEHIIDQLEMITDGSGASGAVLFRSALLFEHEIMASSVGDFFDEALSIYTQAQLDYTPTLTVLSPTSSAIVEIGQAVDILCTAPPGSVIWARSGEHRVLLKEQPVGSFSGQLTAAEDSSAILLNYEIYGAVGVTMLPLTIQTVELTEPSSITKVSFSDIDRGHELSFATENLMSANIVTYGNALELVLYPCTGGVIVEDDFFEGMLWQSTDLSSGKYVFVLPKSHQHYFFDLKLTDKGIVLTIKEN